MSKQGPAETCPQQLVLDFQGPKPVEHPECSGPKILAFVDHATRAVRERAVQRVKTSGIFSLPANLSR
jgi:hypothetical protein